MEQQQETVDIFMNRTDGSAQAANPPKSMREAEVFENPSGGPAVVLMEDAPEDDNVRQPIPARKFAPPPMLPRKAAAPTEQRVFEEKKVLPETDLLQLADLELLANPEKMTAKKKEPEKKTKESPVIETIAEDKPVPPRFPPPPTSANIAPRKSVKKVVTTPGGETVPGPSALKSALKKSNPPSPKPRPAPEPTETETRRAQRRYDEQPHYEYEVEERQPEHYTNDYTRNRRRDERPRGRRSNYFRNPYEEQQEYHYNVDSQRYVDSQERRQQRERPTYDDRRDYGRRENDGRENVRSDRRERERDYDRERRNRRPVREEMDYPEDDQQQQQQEENPLPPPTPAVPPEELRRRREEEEKKEKQHLLYTLYQFERRGCLISQAFSMESSIDELRFEVSKIKNERSAKTSVKWYKVFLMIVTTAVEELNTRFDPFGLRLKKWSKKMHETKDELDDCFYRLHDKYSSKASIEPELELFFAFFGGMFMYHLENAADGAGEIGKIVSHVTGSGTKTTTKEKVVIPQPQTAPVNNIPPGAYVNQSNIMTNMPYFQQQTQQPPFNAYQQPFPQQQQQFQQPISQPWTPNNQQQQQQTQQNPLQNQEPARVGPSGRRIMRAPMIPDSTSVVGLQTLSAAMQNDDDIPIDMTNVEIPISVGGAGVGQRPQTSSATTSSVPSSKTASAKSTSSKSRAKSNNNASRQSAPAPSRSLKI